MAEQFSTEENYSYLVGIETSINSFFFNYSMHAWGDILLANLNQSSRGGRQTEKQTDSSVTN